MNNKRAAERLAFDIKAIEVVDGVTDIIRLCLTAFFDVETRRLRELTPDVAGQLRDAHAQLKGIVARVDALPEIPGTIRDRRALRKALGIYIEAVGLMATGAEFGDWKTIDRGSIKTQEATESISKAGFFKNPMRRGRKSVDA